MASMSLYLYPKLLGEKWESLPTQIREAHYQGTPVRLTGMLDVEVGRSSPARFLCRLLRLPVRSETCLANVEIRAGSGGETWSRCIGKWRLRTHQTFHDGYLRETVGPLAFDFRLVQTGRSLLYEQSFVRVRWLGLVLPVPRLTRLKAEACETAAEPPYLTEISVRLSVAGDGLLIAYRGLMRRADR